MTSPVAQRVAGFGVSPVAKAEDEDDEVPAEEPFAILTREGWRLPDLDPEEQAALLAVLSATANTIAREHQKPQHKQILAEEILKYLRKMSLRSTRITWLANALTQSPPAAIASAIIERRKSVVRSFEQRMAAFADEWAQRHLDSIRRSRTWQRWMRAGGGDFGMIQTQFGTPNPLQVPAFRDFALKLVRDLNDRTREGMQQAIEAALRVGQGPLATARALREVGGFGLTAQQTQAVFNYRRALEEGRWGEARSRALHPRRAAEPTTPQAIGRLVERYSERMARYRANVVARTEQIHAANAGVQAVWDEVQARGGFGNAVLLKRWVTAPENSTFAGIGRPPSYTGRTQSGRITSGPCPLCIEVEALNHEGRRLDEPFETPDGTIDMPPLHPQCRCLLFVVPRFLTLTERGMLA